MELEIFDHCEYWFSLLLAFISQLFFLLHRKLAFKYFIIVFMITKIYSFYSRLDGTEGISTHLSHTFIALDNEMKRIHDIFERCFQYLQCGSGHSDDVSNETSNNNLTGIVAYQHIIFSLLCKCVLDSFHICIQKLKFDHTKEGVISHKSLNPALYQAQEELECLKYVFYTHIPSKYCKDWTSVYGEKLELSTPREKEKGERKDKVGDDVDIGGGDNYWECENILKRSSLFISSFSARWEITVS